MSNKKVVIIGVDGANIFTGERVLGKRPYEFVSTVPPYTPPAWTSILTGVTPSKHGIVGWQKFDFSKGNISIATSRDVKKPRLTELLDMYNKHTVMINLPLTYPFSGIRHKSRSIIVTDWASPVQAIYPKNLMEKYAELLIEPPHAWWLNESKRDKIEYTKKIHKYLEVRLNLYYSLLESEKWDMYFIVFSEIDWISHIIPEVLEGKQLGDIKRIFRLISEFIEDSKNVADVVFVVSDHGFEIKKRIFSVNVALREGGFLRAGSSIKRTVIHLGNRIFPRSIKKFLLKRFGSPTLNILEASVRDKATKAIMIEPGAWGVHLRDDSIASDVISHLNAYEEVKNVLSFEEVYGSKKPAGAPDLFVVPNEGVGLSQTLRGPTVKDVYKSDHEIHGIFYVWGDGILDNISFKKPPTVYDVMPTVLFIMGEAIPNYVDGRVLKEIFDERSVYANRKVVYTHIYTNIIKNSIKIKNKAKNLRQTKRGNQNGIQS